MKTTQNRREYYFGLRIGLYKNRPSTRDNTTFPASRPSCSGTVRKKRGEKLGCRYSRVTPKNPSSYEFAFYAK